MGARIGDGRKSGNRGQILEQPIKTNEYENYGRRLGFVYGMINLKFKVLI